MQVIDAKAIIFGLTWVSSLITKFGAEGDTEQNFSPEALQHRIRDASALALALRKAGLPIASGFADEFLSALKSAKKNSKGFVLKGVQLEKVKFYGNQLCSFTADEAKTKLFFSVASGNAGAFDSISPQFGADVAEKFPCLYYDIGEASKCLALER